MKNNMFFFDYLRKHSKCEYSDEGNQDPELIVISVPGLK